MISLRIDVRGKNFEVIAKGITIFTYVNNFEELENPHTEEDIIGILKAFLLSQPST